MKYVNKHFGIVKLYVDDKLRWYKYFHSSKQRKILCATLKGTFNSIKGFGEFSIAITHLEKKDNFSKIEPDYEKKPIPPQENNKPNDDSWKRGQFSNKNHLEDYYL